MEHGGEDHHSGPDFKAMLEPAIEGLYERFPTGTDFDQDAAIDYIIESIQAALAGMGAGEEAPQGIFDMLRNFLS